MNAVVASGLGRRYGKAWALQDCSFEIPSGRISALVGPNGAGKTTLLHLATGLASPTSGSIAVLGQRPDTDRAVMARIGFVAQDVPLYRSFTVGEMLRFGKELNASWDEDFAKRRIEQLGLGMDKRVGDMSGGQRAQLSLTLALGKRPEVLFLDEPLASLDPLARRDFLRVLMETVAETGLTVVLSSHLITDLERVCDHLIVLSASRAQVVGDIDDLLACHRLVTGPRASMDRLGETVSAVQETSTDRQATIFARVNGPILDPAITVDEVGLDDLVIAYLGSPGASSLPAPRLTLQSAGARS